MPDDQQEFVIHLIGGADDETAAVSYDEDEPVCRLSLRYRDRVLRAEGPDFFEAFCRVREQLAGDRLTPFCYGASLNVYPSGMCRDMGQGLQAYRLTKGVKARQKDLVQIFDEGADVIPASVSLQKEFYDDWLESTGIEKPD